MPDTFCPYWHYSHTVQGDDIYAYSVDPEFDIHACPTVRVASGHHLVCGHCWGQAHGPEQTTDA
jgi:hypothetical protein